MCPVSDERKDEMNLWVLDCLADHEKSADHERWCFRLPAVAPERRWFCDAERKLFVGKWCDAPSGRHAECGWVVVVADEGKRWLRPCGACGGMGVGCSTCDNSGMTEVGGRSSRV